MKKKQEEERLARNFRRETGSYSFQAVCNNLYVDYVWEFSRLLEAVEALDLHGLARDLVRDLVAPLVNHRHVDVVNEHGHALAAWRTIRRADTLLHVALHDPLKSTVIVRRYIDLYSAYSVMIR